MCKTDTLEISFSEIAKIAGVNSALIKYYFGNKEGMMLALLERDVSKGMAQLSSLMTDTMLPADKMRWHIAGMIRMYFRYPYLNRLILALIRDGEPSRAKKIANAFLKPIVDAHKTFIDEGVKLGHFRDIDPEMFYFTLIGACEQLFSARFALHYGFGFQTITKAVRDKYVEHTTNMLMAGLLLPVA